MSIESKKPFGGGDWRLADDGWVSIPAVEGEDIALHVRVQLDESGRYVITGLLLDAPRITADLLRQIQPSRTEATINLVADGRGQAGSSKSDDHLTLGDLRTRTPMLAPADDRIILVRPDGSDPDSFYRQVAEAYRVAAAESRRPAAVIAEDADVPVASVRRWIHEARRRGFLPAGEKGKAG